jgi:hypothetical protein
MSIPLVDGAVAVAYPYVASLAATLHPVGGPVAVIVLGTLALRLLFLPLFRQHKVLLLVLQSPLLLVWYRVFTLPVLAGQANALLAYHFLGAALTAHLFGGPFLAFLPLLAILATLAWLTSRRLADSPAAPVAGVVRVLPYLSLVSACVLPMAAVIYLVTTQAWATALTAVGAG